jgi:methylmalonyl-CoA mutase N-terminal domain/subunit
VGVNRFADSDETPDIPRPDYGQLEAEQIARLSQRRQARDENVLSAALSAVRAAATTYRDDHEGTIRPSLMPAIVDAVRARASIGEIADALRAEWGTYGS